MDMDVVSSLERENPGSAPAALVEEVVIVSSEDRQTIISSSVTPQAASPSIAAVLAPTPPVAPASSIPVSLRDVGTSSGATPLPSVDMDLADIPINRV